MELTELELTLVTLDPLEPEEEDETEDDPLLEFWALMLTKPSCLSVVAENPMGPAS